MKMLLGLLFISIFFNVYLLVQEDQIVISEAIEDSVNLSQAAFNKIECTMPMKVLTKPLEKKKRIYKQLAKPKQKKDNSRFVDREVEVKNLVKWNEESTEFFEYELNLTPDQMDGYKKLAKVRQIEIMAYIQSVKKEKGVDDGPFALSMEEAIKLTDINKNYLSKLKYVFGEEDYEYYSNFKKNFNKKLLKDPNSWAFSIEF